MVRVPFLDPSDLEPQHVALLDRPINLLRVLAHEPDGAMRFLDFGNWIRWESPLDPRLRELVILLVGYIENDEYEWSHHVVLARQFGVSDADIRALKSFADGSPHGFTDSERAALEATRQLTTGRTLRDQTWADLVELLGQREAVNVVMISAFYAMVVRVLGGLEIDVEDSYLPALLEHPLRVANDESHSGDADGR